MDLTALPPALEALKAEGLAVEAGFQGQAGWRLTPDTAEQVARLLHGCQEAHRPVALNPDEATLLSQPLWLDLARLNRVRQYPAADFIIEVEPGIAYDQLAQTLARHGQAFALHYPAQMSLGQILAEDRPALQTGLKGYPRDYVLKTEIATPDGQLTISGADVVKNVTGYDLHKLYVGGQNAFGVITSVTLKLVARPQAKHSWKTTLDSPSAAFDLAKRLLQSPLPLTVCELYQDPGQDWQVVWAVAGDPRLLAECQAILQGLSDRSLEPLEDSQAASCMQALQDWPTHRVVLEAALPMGQWAAFVQILRQQTRFQGWGLQVRPAAGLVYLFPPSDLDEASLKLLQAEAKSRDGFVQIVQMPAGRYEPDWCADANLPPDATIRRLLKTLKNGYDPNRILFAPKLPI